jgi:hypothetical protein
MQRFVLSDFNVLTLHCVARTMMLCNQIHGNNQGISKLYRPQDMGFEPAAGPLIFERETPISVGNRTCSAYPANSSQTAWASFALNSERACPSACIMGAIFCLASGPAASFASGPSPRTSAILPQRYTPPCRLRRGWGGGGRSRRAASEHAAESPRARSGPARPGPARWQ